ncbi:MAG: Type IV pilus biogenesis protein PilM [Candidatus Gottesmanbacteria bacterium GW2011_GWA2_47_9]|uniref:Type IV pilus biogenesis protein PilM n=1 Tax=Candidatus Gottesmanbacteria bacterium GW2011_GWA2_47_9 TaxID=1618445 RepID=A0A0G1TZD2_9BACT|nr:MAG: Type IV pilus biogenesis protein PilM [Candidatus Gottesmanbacteria bacterium GW2011_GWA2_47_9]
MTSFAFSSFSKFFNKGTPTALGVDIGSSAIKIVQIKKKNGQAVLETYGELALGPYSGLGVGQAVALAPDKIAQALTDLMKEKEVNVTTKKCGISIPFASSLMSVIEMPDVSSRRLSVMVPLEARRYIPVPISEVMLDWSVIPKSEVVTEDSSEYVATEGRSPDETGKAPAALAKIDVLIVAIHNETIARYQEIVAKSGLEAGFFEIEIFSTMRAVLDEALRPVMIMDMGAASTKLYVVERGVIRSSHTINRGSQDITIAISKSLGLPLGQAEVLKRQMGAAGEDKNLTDIIILTLDYIFAEVNNTLLAFEKKHNRTISKVILVGGGSALKGLSELARTNFKADVVIADPFSKVSAPAFLEKILKETGPEFAVAIGLALRKLAEEE